MSRTDATLGAQYDRRFRVASEAATVVIAVVLLLTAALPTTDAVSRAGLVISSALLLVFVGVWWHLLPPAIFGRWHFAVGTAATQVLAAGLLELTGGPDSRYFAFYLLPILATVFSLRVEATVITGLVAILGYALVAGFVLVTGGATPEARDLSFVRLLALLATVATVGLIAKTMSDTRDALAARSADLGAQNRVLETAHLVSLALSRLRQPMEIARVVAETAARSIGVDRVHLYIADADHELSEGYAAGAGIQPHRFMPEPMKPTSARARAIRARRTVPVNDLASDPAGAAEEGGTGAAIYVPLLQHGDIVGLASFVSTVTREWSPVEIRVAETMAEASAAAIATSVAFEQVRVATEKLSERTRVLEGLNQLGETLALAPDETTAASASARSLVRAFDLAGATALFTDPSLALLEPQGAAGNATPHPVVSGPTNCPAIRSGRLFRVPDVDAPVVCPYMPVQAGSNGYACVPLIAAGQTMGALFTEPTERSVIDETVLRAAADRIALTVANRRVLETAQRQAMTDGVTGLYNRHFLREQLRLLHSLAERHAQPYAVIALDVDRLKSVNDSLGHEAGDQALRAFANVLRRALRGSDIAVRSGGDEFVALLPNSGLEDARLAAERIRTAVDARATADPAAPAVTASAGVAAWRPGRTSEEVLQRADAMLYEAKRAGRDCVVAETAAVA